MVSDPLNTIVMVLFGALLGTLSTVWFIVIGAYALMRKLLPLALVDTPLVLLRNLPDVLHEVRRWQLQLAGDTVPRSAATALVTVTGLGILLVLTIWISPVRMQWIPFIASFAGAEWLTIGMFEIARLTARASKWWN